MHTFYKNLVTPTKKKGVGVEVEKVTDGVLARIWCHSNDTLPRIPKGYIIVFAFKRINTVNTVHISTWYTTCIVDFPKSPSRLLNIATISGATMKENKIKPITRLTELSDSFIIRYRIVNMRHTIVVFSTSFIFCGRHESITMYNTENKRSKRDFDSAIGTHANKWEIVCRSENFICPSRT